MARSALQNAIDGIAPLERSVDDFENAGLNAVEQQAIVEFFKLGEVLN